MVGATFVFFPLENVFLVYILLTLLSSQNKDINSEKEKYELRKCNHV